MTIVTNCCPICNQPPNMSSNDGGDVWYLCRDHLRGNPALNWPEATENWNRAAEARMKQLESTKSLRPDPPEPFCKNCLAECPGLYMCQSQTRLQPETPVDEPKLQSIENGGSTPSQYAVPETAKELQDLIEHREMNYALGNIFKACYRIGHCSHSTAIRDMNKMIYFAERERDRLLAMEAKEE